MLSLERLKSSRATATDLVVHKKNIAKVDSHTKHEKRGGCLYIFAIIPCGQVLYGRMGVSCSIKEAGRMDFPPDPPLQNKSTQENLRTALA